MQMRDLFQWHSLNLLHLIPFNLHYDTLIRDKLYSKKMHVSTLWFHSNDQFGVSLTVNVHVWRYFEQILSNTSHTVDCLKFLWTSCFIPRFHTVFRLYVFCFGGCRRVCVSPYCTVPRCSSDGLDEIQWLFSVLTDHRQSCRMDVMLCLEPPSVSSSWPSHQRTTTLTPSSRALYFSSLYSASASSSMSLLTDFSVVRC